MSEKLEKELNKMVGGNMFYKKVARVQAELNAPKNLKNNFGGYSYRNVESIYEAVKPLLLREGLALFLTDEVIELNERIYVKATATLTDGYGEIKAIGYAREAGMKKGMDEAQLTGSCSSYARKYALGGLFLIDDNKDIDSMEHSEPTSNKTKSDTNTSKMDKSNKTGKKEPDKSDLVNPAVIDKMMAEFQKIGIEEPDLLGYFGIKKDNITNSDLAVIREYFAEKKAEYSKNQVA